VQEAMLLGEAAAEGPFDRDLPRLDRDQPGTDGAHEGLSGEARLDAGCDVGACCVTRHLGPLERMS